MFDNSLVRFIIFLLVVIALNFIVRRFLANWSSAPVAARAKDRRFTPPVREKALDAPESSEKAKERPVMDDNRKRSREISRVQQELEAPRPDQDMADPYMARKKAMQQKHQELARRSNTNQQAQVQKHKRPHRSAVRSSESGRRIQL